MSDTGHCAHAMNCFFMVMHMDVDMDARRHPSCKKPVQFPTDTDMEAMSLSLSQAHYIIELLHFTITPHATLHALVWHEQDMLKAGSKSDSLVSDCTLQLVLFQSCIQYPATVNQ